MPLFYGTVRYFHCAVVKSVTAVSLHQRQRWRSPSVSVFVCNANAVQLRNSAANLVGPHPSGSCLVNAVLKAIELASQFCEEQTSRATFFVSVTSTSSCPPISRQPLHLRQKEIPKSHGNQKTTVKTHVFFSCLLSIWLILWTFINSSPLPRD